MIFWDTETCLIRPGVLAPPLVCLQTAEGNRPPALVHRTWGGRELAERIVHSPNVGHNVPFDLAVLCSAWPDLIGPVFESLEADLITDTEVRQRLIDIGEGTYRGYRDMSTGVWVQPTYSLAALVKRHCSTTIAKGEETWRLRYGELLNVPVERWPEDAKRYALDDAHWTRKVYKAQGSKSFYLADQYRQTRAKWWLHLTSCWGMMTDPDATEAFASKWLDRVDELRTELAAAGLVDRVTGKRKVKKATELLEAYCKERGLTPERTDKGKVSLKEDALDALDLTGCPELALFAAYGKAQTNVSRARRLRRGYETPIQPSFNSLLDTGRTSCREPKNGGGLNGYQTQNMPREEGVRDSFAARPGYLLCSVDYDGQEMGTLAQVCLWLFGQSDLADAINAGKDIHAVLGAQLHGVSYDALRAAIDAGDKRAELARQTAKPGNFGLPTGMGAAKIQLSAKAYGVELTLSQAQRLKDTWFKTWREMRAYMRHCGDLADSSTRVMQFVSERWRGLGTFTEIANGFFQGLASDMSKDAGFQLAKECYVPGGRLYGSRIVNFVHDEFLLEHPEASAHERAFAQVDIQTGVAKTWTPDVLCTASPAIQLHWRKGAKECYDEYGRLCPWDRKGEVYKKDGTPFKAKARAQWM